MTNSLSSAGGCNEAGAGAIFWRSQTATAMGSKRMQPPIFETGNTLLRRELVDLALRDVQ